MKTGLLLVRDGLEGAAPWMAQVLREAGFRVRTTSAAELGDVAPAEVVLVRITDRNPTAACWNLHRQGYRWIVAVSGSPNSQECIRLLNAGADYYIDAWLPAPELVARVNVVLRFSAWLRESYAHGTLGHQPIPNTAGSRTHQQAMRKVPAASRATARPDEKPLIEGSPSRLPAWRPPPTDPTALYCNSACNLCT